MKVLRFESSLYFGNVERFRSALIAVAGRDPGVQQHKRKEVKLQSGDKAELLENEQEDDFSDNQEIPNGVRNGFLAVHTLYYNSMTDKGTIQSCPNYK